MDNDQFNEMLQSHFNMRASEIRENLDGFFAHLGVSAAMIMETKSNDEDEVMSNALSDAAMVLSQIAMRDAQRITELLVMTATEITEWVVRAKNIELYSDPQDVPGLER